MKFRRDRKFLLGAALGLTLAANLPAQSELFVEHEGQGCLVVNAKGTHPCIDVNGKIVSVSGSRYALKAVDEYAPFLVSIDDRKIKNTYEIGGPGADRKSQLYFEASFTSGNLLENVFLLIELQSYEAGRTLFIYEIGRLPPNEPKRIHFTVPLSSPLKGGQVPFHVFAKGTEVMTSDIPPFAQDGLLDRMVARRIENSNSGEAKPFLGPEPVYPVALRKSTASGSAVITCWIQPNGAVRDPVVKSASDPAFGEAALAAARLWRFLPAVKSSGPVESQVDLPFSFSAPHKK